MKTKLEEFRIYAKANLPSANIIWGRGKEFQIEVNGMKFSPSYKTECELQIGFDKACEKEKSRTPRPLTRIVGENNYGVYIDKVKNGYRVKPKLKPGKADCERYIKQLRGNKDVLFVGYKTNTVAAASTFRRVAKPIKVTNFIVVTKKRPSEIIIKPLK